MPIFQQDMIFGSISGHYLKFSVFRQATDQKNFVFGFSFFASHRIKKVGRRKIYEKDLYCPPLLLLLLLNILNVSNLYL